MNDAAKVLGVGPKSVYLACQNDGLRFVKLSATVKGRIRIKRSWLDDWAMKRSRVK